jgi:hypothetical protein
VKTGLASVSLIAVQKYGAVVAANSSGSGLFGSTGTWAATAP